MTKKFTEEQYQNIIDAWDSQIWYKSAIQSVIDELGIDYIDMGDQALALANPLTRKWAHDKFVEKEKHYIWTSKEVNSSGKHKRLFTQQQSASVRDYFILDKHGHDENELITESEIKKWGHAPERFYKEEV